MARPSSRLPGYFKRTVQERTNILVEQGRITAEEADALTAHNTTLPLGIADSMIENVIGVFGFPIGLALNFLVNERDFVIPMVVEEPSIVAAVSSAAKLVRASGGFHVSADPPMMIGQVQILGVDDPEQAKEKLLAHRDELLELANSFHPNMVERGGGAKDIEVRVLRYQKTPSRYMAQVVLHLIIHTCDAMGANLINTMAEGIAPRVEELSGGRVHLRILSNLADKRLVRARCTIPVEHLDWKSFSGLDVARGIASASDFALLDPYRAATHNKGVMNGIDAVALATGNDWRAIEAGAHAYCALRGAYEPMAIWSLNPEETALLGFLEIPIQVGTVGGPIRLHPMLSILYKILDIRSSVELSQVMGAVGLAQNLAALRALATEGIQNGHMSLHARSVAATAGACGDQIGKVAEQMIQEGNIKVHRATEILADLQNQTYPLKQSTGA